jgi:transcriptional antiterminator
MKSILQNTKGMPAPYIKKQLENLKIVLAKDIRRLKPGVLEAHLDKKTEEATKNTRTCESCKD